MAKTEHSTTRKTTKRRQSPKQKAGFKKVFCALMQKAMKRFVNDALDIVYGPNGKATSRKKAERRIREQNKRLFQRVMAVQS
jgi:hypothetical protein